MSKSISNAWTWSLKHSPLLSVWRAARGLVRPNREAFALLEKAALPGPIEEIIRSTIVRTKLWRDERGQIAKELIAHAQDAIEAGRTPEQIVETFGDPRRVAKLLRRSMKRKRPMSWQLYRFSKRTVGGLAVLMIVGYAVLAVRFHSGAPSIKRNFIAELNARHDQYAEDQKVWPVLHQVERDWTLSSSALIEQHAGTKDLANGEYRNSLVSIQDIITAGRLDDSDPLNHLVAQRVRAFEPQLAMLRAAAQRPVVGMPYSYDMETVLLNDSVYGYEIRPAPDDPEEQESLISILLPDLGAMRRFANLYSFDIAIATREQDQQRVFENLRAMANLARLCHTEHFMISQLCGYAIMSQFHDRLVEVMRSQPDSLSSEQVIELAHLNARVLEMQGLDLSTERFGFQDILQRAYTDDGHGNGRLTPQGVQMFMEMTRMMSSNDPRDYIFADRELKAATQPLLLMGVGDRRQEWQRYNRMVDRAERVLAEGPQAFGWMSFEEQLLESHADDTGASFSPAQILTPALGSAVGRSFQSRLISQTTGVMLAIEIFRRDNGRLPETLDELVGTYLPQVPEDIFNPGRPIGYVKDANAGYVLYSVGSDGDDDGGIEPDPEDKTRSGIGYRYAFQVGWQRGRPVVIRDNRGQPAAAAPRGPDSDWVLVDTRPQPQPAGES